MKEYRVVRMYSEDLKREVRVFIMLPNTYFKNERFYPVLYMHDGQNLFDPATSYGGVSWGILEAYENNPDLPEVVIVGIENGGEERSNELVPFNFKFSEVGYPEWGDNELGGKTDLYMKFILEDVKPYIDKTYRTFKAPKNTAIMGSSFGGVCSTYAAIKYNDYFSRFGCVSNAYWVIQKEMEEFAETADLSNVKKLYMDVGTAESSTDIDSNNYIKSNQDMFDILSKKIDRSRIHFQTFDGAIHKESAWADRFPDIIKFLFND